MAIVTERKFLVTGQTIFLIRPRLKPMAVSVIKRMYYSVQIIALVAVLAIRHGMTMAAGIRLNLPINSMVLSPGYGMVSRFKAKVFTMTTDTPRHIFSKIGDAMAIGACASGRYMISF